jgi:hypothetical protein
MSVQTAGLLALLRGISTSRGGLPMLTNHE